MRAAAAADAAPAAPASAPRRPPPQGRRPAALLLLRSARARPLPAPPRASSGFDGFLTLGSLLKPEAAALVSAVVALSSVGLNYFSSLATEQRRAALQAQLENERSMRAQQAELQSIIGRYRGPLLESSVDLEQRLWHMATATGEWSGDPSAVCFEEVTYTLFTLAQFLGFLEIVRREGPRERSFLQLGSPHGGDTLATLLEGVKYALCASPGTLEAWLAEPDARRDHPGARSRTRSGGGGRGGDGGGLVAAARLRRPSGRGAGGGEDGDATDSDVEDDRHDDGARYGRAPSAAAHGVAPSNGGSGNGDGSRHSSSSSSADASTFTSTSSASSAAADAAAPGLRISRGLQRAVGSVMTATPMGAERHYTLSYSDFVLRLRTDAAFASWFAPLERDLVALLTGPSWRGRPPGGHPWTRVLLLQQLLVDCVDLLDPDFVRVPPSRRLRLSPLRYAPLPNLDVFRLQLSALSTGIDPIISEALRQVNGGNAGGEGVAEAAVLASGGGDGGASGGGESRSLFLQWARSSTTAQKRGIFGAGPANPANPPAALTSRHFAALANLQAEWDGTVSSDDGDGERGDGGAFGGRPGGGPVLPAELVPDYGATGVCLVDLKQQLSARLGQNKSGGVGVRVGALLGGAGAGAMNGGGDDGGALEPQRWSLLAPLGGLLTSVGSGAKNGK
jgi:hypothetical protein